MASVFNPQVVSGWRDPYPPVATPGVVWKNETTNANLATGARTRIPSYYLDDPLIDTYIDLIRFLSSNRIQLRATTIVSSSLRRLSTEGLASLALVFRAGRHVLAARISDATRTSSTYTWTFAGTAVEDFRSEISTDQLVRVALVDWTVDNILWETGEVVNPNPIFVPITAVPSPISFFHEAVVPGFRDPDILDATPGCVWSHSRRGRLDAVSGRAVLVESTNPVIPQATRRIPPFYAFGVDDAYVVRLDVTATELRLDIQPAPGSPHFGGHPRDIDLNKLGLAIRSANGLTVGIPLESAITTDAEEPYVWTLSELSENLRAGLLAGTAVAVLVDTTNENVDFTNLQFRRVGADDSGRIRTEAQEPITSSIKLSIRRAADTIQRIQTTSEEVITATAELTRTPYTGRTPASAPISLEINERPVTGKYRSKRWIDHTGEVKNFSITRALGEVGDVSVEMPPIKKPTGSFEVTAPEYLNRATSIRLLGNNDIGLVFREDESAALIDFDDVVILDSLTTSPLADLTKLAWRVTGRELRGGQRYDLFDHGAIGSTQINGIRARSSSSSNNNTVPLGFLLGGVEITSMFVGDGSFAFTLEGEQEDLIAFFARHYIFVRHNPSGESWRCNLPLLTGSTVGAAIIVTIPESERGRLRQLFFDRDAGPWTTVVVEAFNAENQPNPRLDVGQRSIILGSGDSLFDAVVPTAPDVDIYAGLSARLTVPDPGSGAGEHVLSDNSLRPEIATDRFVSRIRISAGNRILVDIQDRVGNPSTLPDSLLSSLTVAFRAGTAVRLFPMVGATYLSGTYTLSASAAALRADFDGDGRVTIAFVDTSYYTVDGTTLELNSDYGDYVELSIEPPLVPNSPNIRYLAVFGARAPQIAYASTRATIPWTPVDGAEFRCLLHQWSSNRATLSIPSPGVLRMTRDPNGLLPPLVEPDKVIVLQGILLSDGRDPSNSSLPIRSITPTHIDVEAPAILSGEPGRWYRAIDRVPVMGGWLINPRGDYPNGDLQHVTIGGTDYSAVIDRRYHGGGRFISRAGQTSGEVLDELVQQWQTQIEGVGSEGLGTDLIDLEVGGTLEVPFDTQDVGGGRASWRENLEALQSHVDADILYSVDANKKIIWEENGLFSGLTLLAPNYVMISVTEDRNRARNVVDVRQSPESTISVKIEGNEDIKIRQRIEGGTGRYEAIDDSREGTDPGLQRALTHGKDALLRYPFIFSAEISVLDVSPLGLSYRQLVALLHLRPGQTIRVGGPHLPPIPRVTATIIGPGQVCFAPSSDDTAIPAAVSRGKYIRVAPEHTTGEAPDRFLWGTDAFLWGEDHFLWADEGVDQEGLILEVGGPCGPRGAFWCTLPEGATITVQRPISVQLVDNWLVTGLTITPLLGKSGLKNWNIEVIRPREIIDGPTIVRAPGGERDQWRKILSGLLG